MELPYDTIREIALNSDIETLINLSQTSTEYRELFYNPVFRRNWLNYRGINEIRQLLQNSQNLSPQQIQFILSIVSLNKYDIIKVVNRILELDNLFLFKLVWRHYLSKLQDYYILDNEEYRNDIDNDTFEDIGYKEHELQRILTEEEKSNIRNRIIFGIFMVTFYEEVIKRNAIKILKYLYENYPHEYESDAAAEGFRSSYPPDRAIATFNFILESREITPYFIVTTINNLLEHEQVIDIDFLKHLITIFPRYSLLSARHDQMVALAVNDLIAAYVDHNSNLELLNYLLESELLHEDEYQEVTNEFKSIYPDIEII